ncbi:MAG: SpoIIE family protein phosphatase [Flavobacteriales bacterium]|nr:SpoIIE family protein phosphatase [Flavobacteriales bacterium]
MLSKIEDCNWKQELDKLILKYHLITCKVAVVFNLLFSAADYFNIPKQWVPFLMFRVVVSAIILFFILTYKKFKISIEMLGFIPVFLISIENAYMWSVMDISLFQQHTFSYLALFIGSGMFVLYNTFYSLIIIVVSLFANVILMKLNSSLSINEIMVNGGFLTIAVALFSVFLIRTRFNLTKKEIVSRLALQLSYHELSEKNEIIEGKTKEIIDSINYAKRIQEAIITPEEVLKKSVPNSFVFFQPKDIVSGDFYWYAELSTSKENSENEQLVVFSVADCTGHGVPGAFMSLIGMKILNQSITQKDVNTPAEALDYLNIQIFETINKYASKESLVRDGMDAVLFAINFDKSTLSYAGANNPLYIIRNNEVIELKADKQPIGSFECKKRFTNQTIDLNKDDTVYAFTDGYIDQFGGKEGKKLKSKRFKEKLVETSNLPIEQQKEFLRNFFNEWKGDNEQLDDVCIMGVKI